MSDNNNNISTSEFNDESSINKEAKEKYKLQQSPSPSDQRLPNNILLKETNNNNNNINNNSNNNMDGSSNNSGLASSPFSNLNNTNQNRLRLLNRASSLQNLSSTQPPLVDKNGLSIHHHHHSNKNHEESSKVEEKFNLIKYDASNSNHPTPSSKYDFVKVKVRLENHYYVLSRFLISRVLNVTKVDAADSVKISLALKKTLVDQGRLTLTQAELENELFKLLQQYGYGKEYIERYKMTTQFHHQRVPLIILISGPKFIGKSWLATQLAERLNLSTVLQTTLVHDLMYTIIKEFQPKPNENNSDNININSVDNNNNNNNNVQINSNHPGNMFGMPSDPPIAFKNYKTKEELISEFKKECVMIRHGVDTDIEKCFEEGKAIIIEGPHIDPNLFVELISERNMISPIQFVFEKTKSNEDLIRLELEKQRKKHQQQKDYNENENINSNNKSSPSKHLIQTISDEIPTEIPPTVNENKPLQPQQQQESQPEPTSALPKEGEQPEITEEQKKLAQAALLNSLRKPKTKGIIIPFVLSINPEDHKLFIENWLSTSPIDQITAEKAFGPNASVQTRSILNNLQTIQEYLVSGCPPFQKVEVNAHCPVETLDVLHSAVLKRINTAYSGHVKGFDYES
ncbi:hypothetical protein DICPUDRAFT_74916 [Dictyostelium purpureum]|uniref:2-phosphoglycerate kinase n=1 Tax=Dictyostelium purpureum TaxID=5786 RepID=F0Z943_DICPU|nr:uncharacterized protein DICPUDRAFT_74916 [Dictyostelium purpureum]EGC39490.1 hypothetical protein DICPUDRAFT_74916 [Dictyostelium purpureum]|eukprot:XP_003283937.1 hypothetical protein DICPUDRAFT_74916 [Dictyostelium purpureum]